jgi:hypothetical protein
MVLDFLKLDLQSANGSDGRHYNFMAVPTTTRRTNVVAVRNRGLFQPI